MTLILSGTDGVLDNSGAIERSTSITLTNQTAPAFTGVPSWVKRVTLMLQSVSTNGNNPPLIQLGTGSTPTYTTSGYVGSNGVISTGVSTVNFTSGFGIGVSSGQWAGTVAVSGAITISSIGSNIWVANGSVGGNAAANVWLTTGSISLGATLTAIRLFIDGTQQFDAGTINIIYE